MLNLNHFIVCPFNSAISGFDYWLLTQKARLSMRGLMFSQLCCEAFRFSGMWCCGTGWVVVNIFLWATWSLKMRAPWSFEMLRCTHPAARGHITGLSRLSMFALHFLNFSFYYYYLLYSDVTVFWSWRNLWWSVDSDEFSKISNKRLGLVRLVVLPFLIVEITVFQDVMTCVVKIYKDFRRNLLPLYSGLVVNMDLVCSSSTLMYFY